jgi:hypothetical protein
MKTELELSDIPPKERTKLDKLCRESRAKSASISKIKADNASIFSAIKALEDEKEEIDLAAKKLALSLDADKIIGSNWQITKSWRLDETKLIENGVDPDIIDMSKKSSLSIIARKEN